MTGKALLDPEPPVVGADGAPKKSLVGGEK